jgi:hypothetical protein
MRFKQGIEMGLIQLRDAEPPKGAYLALHGQLAPTVVLLQNDVLPQRQFQPIEMAPIVSRNHRLIRLQPWPAPTSKNSAALSSRSAPRC